MGQVKKNRKVRKSKKSKRVRKNPQIFANPYAYGASGFYFEDLQDYKDKYKKNYHGGQLVEEYSFEFIDGDKSELAIWRAMGGDTDFVDLKKYFKIVETFDDDDTVKLYFLMEYENQDLEEALENLDEVYMREGEGGYKEKVLENYAWDWVEEHGMPSNAYDYFDYDHYGRELRWDYKGYDEDEKINAEDELEELEGNLDALLESIDDTKEDIKSLKKKLAGKHTYPHGLYKSEQQVKDILEVDHDKKEELESEKDDLESEIEEKKEEVEQLQENADYYDNMSDSDFAEEFIDSTYGSLADMVELGVDISSHFDYKRFGKYMDDTNWIQVFQLDGTYYVADYQ